MNKKANIYLMYIIVFLQGFVFYGPIATLYRQNRNLSLSNMFLIESISWILMIIFEVPWGWFADKFGYKKTLVISNFIFFISKIIFYKANSFGMFFLERVLLSVSLAGISGCDIALLYSSVEQDESEKVFGRYNAFSTGGYLIGSIMFSILVKKSMDSTAFWTIISYAVAAALTLFIKEVNVEQVEKPKFKQSLLTAFKNKKIIILVISFALINEVVQVVGVFLNQAQYVRSGINIKYFGILAVVMQIVRLSSIKAYKLSIKLGKDRSIQILYSIITICCIILVFTSNATLTILSIIFICGSAAIISPIVLDIENKSISTIDRATLLSVFAMFGDLTAAGVNVIIGKTADISTSSAFITCVIMCTLAYILLFIYKKQSIKEILQVK
ncbi:MFS transporter [Clostridium tagluense]|uniref:MFS transporter n=1 Tax=Clostridium tagluense TaxID=360422 RepID=UPI001CF347F5|nr:MFS transporter [Clostridium tagluense]MCB2311308.1 MFS transporter [Clostridium tagluense]MCB2316050.1 MFS transporter [Clostridium tagluense]MCB2320884.1 MFS transporter [Clostridium tagluense]MCB2325919.1 MFS transporter [Clostridium tagluense]MCB2330624.1 MFS transporter [Clostridium tagluense]